MKNKPNKINFKAIDAMQADNAKAFAEFLKFTKDTGLQLTNEQQRDYAMSFFNYMSCTDFKPKSVLKSFTFNKRYIALFIGGIAGTIFLSLSVILSFIILDMAHETRPWIVMLYCLFIISFGTWTASLWKSIANNAYKFSTIRKYRVGDLYYYDPDCEHGSQLVFEPLLVQIVRFGKVKGMRTIECVDCETGSYITIYNHELLVPVKKKVADGIRNYIAVRLPAAFPDLTDDDITIIDSAIVNAKRSREESLVSALINLRGKVVYYRMNKNGEHGNMAERYKKTNAMLNDIRSAAEYALRKNPDNPAGELDPVTLDMINKLKEEGVQFHFLNVGENNEEVNDYLQDLFKKINPDYSEEDEDDDYDE